MFHSGLSRNSGNRSFGTSAGLLSSFLVSRKDAELPSFLGAKSFSFLPAFASSRLGVRHLRFLAFADGLGQQVGSQLGFDFFDGRQAAAEVFGQGVGEPGLPLGDGDRLVEAAQGVFGDKAVLFPAQQKPDGRLVVRVAQEIVYGGEVEIELADIAGSKVAGFQFDDHIATQLQGVEKQIERIVLTADLQPD